MPKNKNYKIVLELELSGTSPLDAAKTAQNWVRDEESPLQYYVQDDNEKIFSVDLSEDDEDATIELKEKDYRPLI